MGTTVAITLASGDADLFVSFETTQPTKEKHTWAAAGRTDCQLVDCGNTIQGGDAIHIPAKDARLCRDANGLYTFPCFAFIGVYGSEASVFTISQTFADDERPVALVDGVEQAVSLKHAGEYAYFSFSVGLTVKSFEVAVTPTSGDPDMYMTTNKSFPTRARWDWRSTGEAGEVVTIGTDAAGACVPCEYHIAVYAWKPDTTFSVVATSTKGTRLLLDGMPAKTEVTHNQVKYFRYFVRTASPIEVVLTPFSGDPNLYARFGTKPFNPSHKNATDIDPTPGGVSAASVEETGLDAIVLRPGDGAWASCGEGGHPPCTLYVAVRGAGDKGSSFSVVVSQRRSRTTTLVDGVPQAGVAVADELRYYTFTTPDLSNGLGVSIVALAGTPKLYLSPDDQLPNASHYVEYADSSAPLRVAPRSGKGAFVFAVSGQGHPANFSLLAHTGRGMVLMQPSTPTEAKLLRDEEGYYAIHVAADAEQPVLAVTAYQGAVRLLLKTAKNATRPTDAVHDVATTADPRHPAVLALTPGTTAVVRAAPYGAVDELGATTFSLTPLMGGADGVALLYDGRPLALGLQAGVTQAFRFVAPAGDMVSFSAVQLGTNPTASITIKASQAKGLKEFETTAEAGSMANLLILGTVDGLSCAAGASCMIYLKVTSSETATISVTAASQGALTQLPIGVPVAGAAAADGYSQFALMLDPDSDADDDLTVDVQMCSGSAELYVGQAAAPTKVVHDLAAPKDAPHLALGPSLLAGKSRLYASVHAMDGHAASFEVEVREASKGPSEMRVDASTGNLQFDGASPTELRLRFNTLPTMCMGCKYEVWYGIETTVSVFDSWCGVQKAGVLLASEESGTLTVDGTSARYVVPLAAAADEGRCATANGSFAGDVAGASRAAAAARARRALFAEPCAVTRSGERYHVTVVGVSSSKKRFVYRPIRWTPGMGGMSAGGVFGVIVLVLLGICCCGYCGAVATGRTKNRHGWMVDAVRDRLPDELPLPSLASLRSRLPTAGRGGYTRRRNDSASGMAAGLVAGAAPMPESGYMAPLTAPSPAFASPLAEGAAAADFSASPLQINPGRMGGVNGGVAGDSTLARAAATAVNPGGVVGGLTDMDD